MKKLNKILIGSVLSFFILSTSACSENQPNASDSSSTYDPPVISTETYLVKNGVSPYDVVIPQNPSEREKFAASELVYFFSLSTGITLSIIDDGKVENVKGKHLSLGQTSIMRDSGISVQYGEIGNDGYKVKTNGDAIVMCGATDFGTLFAVYGYLGKQFNLKIYTEDLFTYDVTNKIKLLDADFVDVPDIPFRTGGTYYNWLVGQKASARYRMRNYFDGWRTWGHSQLDILPPATYWYDHPDWYNNQSSIDDVTQLAWANEQMWNAMVEVLKEKISADNNQYSYYMLGHGDNRDAGTGGNYEQIKAQYNNSDSAMEIRFLNYVVRKINKWCAVEYPEKVLEFGMFAYYSTIDAPVKWDSEAGKYVPISPDVVMEDNLGIMLAPIDTPVSHGYCDEKYNNKLRLQFEGWAAVTKRIQVWGYSTNFWNYYTPMNSWGSIKQNYMDYKRLGVTFLYEQGCLYKAPGFLELRQYLVSKLSWDSSLDEEALIKDFIKVYYGAGWEKIYEYFNLMRNKLTELETKGIYAYTAGYLLPEYTKSEYFPKPFLDICERSFDDALTAAKTAGDERAYKLIEAERLPLRYLMFEMYQSYYDSDAFLSMVHDFDRVATEHNYIYYNENMTKVSGLIDKWIASVS